MPRYASQNSKDPVQDGEVNDLLVYASNHPSLVTLFAGMRVSPRAKPVYRARLRDGGYSRSPFALRLSQRVLAFAIIVLVNAAAVLVDHYMLRACRQALVCMEAWSFCRAHRMSEFTLNARHPHDLQALRAHLAVVGPARVETAMRRIRPV